MGVWWELYEKYEEELVKLEPFEDDDEEMIRKVGAKTKTDTGNSTVPSKKKSNVRLNQVTLILYRKTEREKVKKQR